MIFFGYIMLYKGEKLYWTNAIFVIKTPTHAKYTNVNPGNKTSWGFLNQKKKKKKRFCFSDEYFM